MTAAELPHGQVTFLFTDIEGSTQLNRELGPAYANVLKQYHDLITTEVSGHRGVLLQTEGDGCFAAFAEASDAVRAAVTSQLELSRRGPHHHGEPLKVRMGMHTGRAFPVDGQYTSLAVHRAARISASANGGQIVCSSATAVGAHLEDMRDVRLRDLGPYQLKDFPEPEHILQVLHPGLPERFPPLRASSPRVHNLPLQLTAFIGREREIEEVKKLIDTDELVTIVGSGGGGKTRLAIEVAGRIATSFDDGAWLVELASLTDASLVSGAVARALGLSLETDRDSVEGLKEALARKQLLLLLDNCEHLLDACAALVDGLLRSCPGLRILATSRERIGVPAEVVWRIPSLDVPAPGAVTASEMVEHDAVQLFVARASHTYPQFVLNSDNGPAIAEICRRLDGIPLAIELAAARVGSLQPEEVASMLDDRFALLSEGNRGAMPRHRTLRAALEWSYELLTPAEQALFDCLGIFAGGWSIDAVQAICASRVDSRSIPLVLSRLDQCSLVMRRAQEDGPRYEMLETVRELARAHLEEIGESDALRVAHLKWYLLFAQEADLEGAAQRKWLEAIGVDHDNLRAALAFACESEDHRDAALSIASRLAPFWRIHGDLAEGFGWLESGLAVTDESNEDRAGALLGAGGLAVTRGDYAVANDLLEQSAELFRRRGDLAGSARTGLDLAWVAWHQGNLDKAHDLLQGYLEIFDGAGDTKGLGDAHRMLGVIASERHDLEEATSHLERALALFQGMGDEIGCAAALASLGITAEYRGDLESACSLMEDSLAIARECGDRRRVAGALDNLGFFWQQRGDLDRARQLHRESLEISRDVGDQWLVAATLTNLGSTARQQGAFTEARQALVESLSIARDTADRSRDVADVLEEIAALDVEEGELRKGLTLFAAAEAIRRTVGYPLREFFLTMYEPLISGARSVVSDHADLWAAGLEISVDQAITLAIGEATESGSYRSRPSG